MDYPISSEMETDDEDPIIEVVWHVFNYKILFEVIP